LEATIACIVERGYAGASTTEICKRAGVSRGAQLHHYPTKGQLVAAAVEWLFETRHAEFRETMATVGEADRLDAAGEALWEIYSGPTLLAWMELVVAARTDPALREHVAAVDRRFFEDAKSTFRRVFGDTPQTAAATRMLTSLFDGLALHHVVNPDPAVIADVLALFKLLIRRLVS
jgi:AcrR family transcriptional regulator